MDYRIHEAKVLLRLKVLKNSRYLLLSVLKDTLEKEHYDDIHHAPYKEENGRRVYNENEAEYTRLSEEIKDLGNRPRHLYLEALECFGGESDEPPCARNLTKKQKKKLLKNLKEKLRECAST